MSKTENYNKLADKIYALINQEDPSFGDTIASLELVRLWVYTDYQDMHNDNRKNHVEVIETEEEVKL